MRGYRANLNIELWR